MTRSLATIDRSGRRQPAAGGWLRSAAERLVATLLVLLAAGPLGLVQAADAPTSRITIKAEPFLAGIVRPGEWAAVLVHVENDGPAASGELRIASTDQASSTTYGLLVELATGARQDHILYGKAGFFGSRFTIDLVEDGVVVATVKAAVEAMDPSIPSVYVVAERPERLLADIRASIAAQGADKARLSAIAPEGLPPRVEAWAAVDRLVWQDVPVTRLSAQQLAALGTWVALGGELVILGGSTGVTAIEGFPAELLPYQPSHVMDVPIADLADLLGVLPTGATTLPAVAGPLLHGTPLARSGGDIVAARGTYGQGSVTLLGIDPATPLLGGTPVATALWARVLPGSTRFVDPRAGTDDSSLVEALSYLASVEVPRMDHLFLLFLGYVLLLGPVSYLVLRRLDRREWAWFTIPALAIAFTGAAFVLGIVLRGSDVVVNELGIVRGAAGGERGTADVYVGVFSPTRSTFEVRLPGGPLISEPRSDQGGTGARPLDVLLGDPARLRGLQVGSGDLRGFRAQATVQTPRLDTALSLLGDRLHGTVTNASGEPLEHVSVAYGGGLQVLEAMAAGETRSVDVAPEDPSFSRRSLQRQMFESSDDGGDTARPVSAARLAILRSLSGGWSSDGESIADPLGAYGPVILAWRSGGVLDVEIGADVSRVGETLFLMPVRVATVGPVAFTGGTVRHSVLAIDALEGEDDPDGSYLVRGTMAAAYRPVGFEGIFTVTNLSLRLGDRAQTPATPKDDLAAMPDALQPGQDDPLDSTTAGAPGQTGGLPVVQLFDRETRRWVEFEPMRSGRSYRVPTPGRYVDASGGFLVRFVSRTPDGPRFALGVRLEGTAR